MHIITNQNLPRNLFSCFALFTLKLKDCILV